MTPVLPAGCVIALLGAESTGKTPLARALAKRLTERGIAATLVPDGLREWREREGRAPNAGEQATIAAAQTKQIAEAATHGVVIADTTALMTAVHSQRLFGDDSLYAGALAAQRGYAVTLLTATDNNTSSVTDELLRAALVQANLPFAVVHGQGGERLVNAWNAINAVADPETRANAAPRARAAPASWSWACDKCSDPACEHRLFSDLVAQRR
jgi:nicotinamide riboside kinase